MAETKIQPIPGVHNLATDVQAFAQPVKQAVEVLLGRAGDPLDAALTLRKFRQLKLGSGSSGSGGATGGGGGGTVVIPGGTYVPDLTPPPAPANLTVTSGFATIFLEWDDTPYTQGHGHAYTEVWRASEDMRGNAVLLGSSPGTIYVDAVGNSAGPFYYWVRFKTRDGVVGPFNATAGVEGSTSPSPAYLLTLLSGAITSSQLSTALTTQLDKIDGQQIAIAETSTIVDGLSGQYTVKIDNNGYVSGFGLASTPGIDGTPYSDFQIRADRFSIVAPGQTKVVPFTVLTTPTMINGVEVPAGTYIDAAYLRLLVVNNAQIGTAAIDDAKIANLSAAKLTAGDGTIGGRLKSTFYVPGLIGWQIHPDGTAEFNNVTVRGTVYATNGVFQGTLIGGGASDFPVGTGMWSGYTGGIYKWRIGIPGSAGADWDGEKFTIYGKDGNPIFQAGGNGGEGVYDRGGAGANGIYNTARKIGGTENGWATYTNNAGGWVGGYGAWRDDPLTRSLPGEVSRLLTVGSAPAYSEFNTSPQMISFDAGSRIEASVYVGSDAGATSELDVVWLDSAGSPITTETLETTSITAEVGIVESKWIDILTGQAKIAAQSAINAGLFGYRVAYGQTNIEYYESNNNSSGYTPVITSIGSTIRVAMGRSADTPDTIEVYDLNCQYLGSTKKNSIESAIPPYATGSSAEWFMGAMLDGSAVTFQPVGGKTRPLTTGSPAECIFKIGSFNVLPVLPANRQILAVLVSASKAHVIVITAPAGSSGSTGDQWCILEWDFVSASASIHSQGAVKSSDYFTEYYLTGIYAKSFYQMCFESDLKHIWRVDSTLDAVRCYEISDTGELASAAIYSGNMSTAVLGGGAINNGFSTPSIAADGGLCVVVGRANIFAFSRSAGVSSTFSRQVWSSVQPPSGGTTIDKFKRLGKIVSAPDGAKKAYLAVRATPANSGSLGVVTPPVYLTDTTGQHNLISKLFARLASDSGLGANVMAFDGSFGKGGYFETDDSGFDFGVGDFYFKVVFKPTQNKPFTIIDNYNNTDGCQMWVNTSGGLSWYRPGGYVSVPGVTISSGSIYTLVVSRTSGVTSVTVNGGAPFTFADTANYKRTGKFHIGGAVVRTSNVYYIDMTGYISYVEVRKAGNLVFGFNNSIKRYTPPYQTSLTVEGLDATSRHVFMPGSGVSISDNKIVCSGSSGGLFSTNGIDDFAFGAGDFYIRVKFNPSSLPSSGSALMLLDHSHLNSVWWQLGFGSDGVPFFKTSSYTLTANAAAPVGSDSVVEVSRTGATTSIKINGGTSVTIADGLVYSKSSTSLYPIFIAGSYSGPYFAGTVSVVNVKKAGVTVLSVGEIAFPSGAPAGIPLDPSVPMSPGTIKDNTGRHPISFIESATVFSDGVTLDGNGDWCEVSGSMADFAFGLGDYKIKVSFNSTRAQGTLLSCATADGDGWELWFDTDGKLWFSYAGNLLGVAHDSINSAGGLHTLELSRYGGMLYVSYDGVSLVSDFAGNNMTANISVSSSKLYIGAKVSVRDAALDFMGKILLVEITQGTTSVFSFSGSEALAAIAAGTVVFTRAFMAVASTSQTVLSDWREGIINDAVSPSNPITPDNIDSIIDPSTMDALVRITNENRSRRLALKVIGGAYIDDLSIGTAHIKDLSVDTIKIKDEAVTAPRFSESSSSIVLPALDGGALIPILTLPAVNANSAPVALFVCVGQYDPWWEAVYPYTPVLCRDGVPIVSLDTPNANASHMAQMFFDQSPGASPVYSIQIPVWNANPLGATYSGYRSILALAVKK